MISWSIFGWYISTKRCSPAGFSVSIALGRLIAKGTGEKLLDYARRVLFEPLGFGPSEWTVGYVLESRTRRRACGYCRATR